MTDVDPAPLPMSDTELGAAIRALAAEIRDARATIWAAEVNLNDLRAQHQAQLDTAEANFAARKAALTSKAFDAYTAVMAQLDANRQRIDDAITAGRAQENAAAEAIAAAKAALRDAEDRLDTLLEAER